MGHLFQKLSPQILCTLFAGATMLSGAPHRCLGAQPPARNARSVQAAFGHDGLASLKSGSDELLSDGRFDVKTVLFTRPDGTAVNRPLGTGKQTIDPKARRVTRAYDWGAVSCTATPAAGRVNFDIAISNHSGDVLSGVLIQLLTLKFPGGVKSFEDGLRTGSNVDKPTVVGVEYGSGALAAANDDVTQPLYFGLPTGDPKKPDSVFPLLAATYRDAVFPSAWMASPRIDRPIYPGESAHLHLSLRTGPAGAAPDTLATDVYRKYAAAYPSHLTWKDRRPIGYLNLSVTVPHPGNGKNPRGWFNNDPAVDVTTPEGRQALQTRLLDLADHCIPLLKATDAQGVIIWDIEGQEYPHAMSYVGDPRHLPAEVDPVADRFFQKFRDAGLRVGVCLRPQKPMKTLYGDIAEQVQVADHLYNLNDKIAYAKKRWGCTLFYVDSNVHFDLGSSPSDEKAYELLPARLFQDAATANPDVLLIPEQQTTRYYAYGAPYDELKQDIAATPAAVRRIYPDSFTVISVATDTSGGPLDTRRAELIDSVRHGDILLFRAWYETPEMKPVQEIYQAAKR
ncbi:hypothetical protein CCAX7_15180 [Capsulimonas corticalis]|uniref:Uncharacterized protein n=1 Tax=Capsulimonas corticalis TaxID=2219043 RepID=A0A402CZA1_9BACT|nr:hypothetical protein [Capsulimonas corticalis]BDI29467.1 hypothetical protein CCAX7_15180 [Capsulimonas corticalis]